MKVETLTQGAASIGAATGTTITVVLDQLALAFFQVPLSAVTAAMTGALVPNLVMDREPLGIAFRRWAGSVAFSLVLTGLVVLMAGFVKPAATTGVAGVLAMFGRDLFAAIRGQVPPLVGGLLERITGKRKEGEQ